MKINPGACGLITTVEVRKKDARVFMLELRSDCEMIQKLGETLPELSMTDCFKRILDSIVYKQASACLKHVSCPVPSGILKTLEVEAGLAVAKDVSMKFLKD